MDHQTFDEQNEGHFESEEKTVQKTLRGGTWTAELCEHQPAAAVNRSTTIFH